jgi:hypothetical protein
VDSYGGGCAAGMLRVLLVWRIGLAVCMWACRNAFMSVRTLHWSIQRRGLGPARVWHAKSHIAFFDYLIPQLRPQFWSQVKHVLPFRGHAYMQGTHLLRRGFPPRLTAMAALGVQLGPAKPAERATGCVRWRIYLVVRGVSWATMMPAAKISSCVVFLLMARVWGHAGNEPRHEQHDGELGDEQRPAQVPAGCDRHDA